MAGTTGRVVVVGGGITGLTATLSLRREGYECTLIDRSGAGGQLSVIARIDDLPGAPAGTSGVELFADLMEQVVDAGCDTRFDEVTAISPTPAGWMVTTSTAPLACDAVIVATGSTLASLDVPGEAELRGRGVITCAVCDGWAFKGKRICIVGGGDSAIDETLYLSEVAEHVTMVYRGHTLRGSQGTAAKLHALPHVRQMPRSTVSEVIGTVGVEAVRIRDLDTNREELIGVDGIGIYIGLLPNTGLLADLVSLTSSGHVATGETMATERPGLFVAGDIRLGSTCRLVTCASDGTVAAMSAAAYIRSM